MKPWSKINSKYLLWLFILAGGIYIFYIVFGDDAQKLRWRFVLLVVVATFGKHIGKEIKRIAKTKKCNLAKRFTSEKQSK